MALDRGIPIIPILVEGTPPPSSGDLPESLRPLLIKQMMPLDSSSFESDMARLEQAVALILPLDEQEADRGKTARRTLYAAAGAVLIAAIAVVLLLTLPGRHHSGSKAVPPLTAASEVLKVQSPDLLAKGLLVKGLSGPLPSNVSSNAAQLSATSPDGLTHQGLTATVHIPLTGPASAIDVYYHIFQNQGDASSYYYKEFPFPRGYRPMGRLTDVGVGDQTKCNAARQATPSGSRSWGCLSLSGTVVTSSVVVGDNKITALAVLERELAPEVIRNLQTVAATTSHKPLPDPPAMTSAMVMTGSDVYYSLASSFPAALMPSGLSSPNTSQDSYKFSGLINGKYINVNFTGPDEIDILSFYVFGTPSQARSYFAAVTPSGPTGALDQATRSYSVSGFSSSQQVKCGTWSQRAVHGTPALGDSDCFVQWGDVVIDGGNLIASSRTYGNTDLALALARSGVLRLAQIMES